jgi:cleavage stimulation factor subunit 1
LPTQVRSYRGAAQGRERVQSCFSHNEEFVVSTDESSGHVVLWDARTGLEAQRLSGIHGVSRWVCASPAEPMLLVCSDDHKIRVFTPENPL